MPIISIDNKKCGHCYTCVRVCPVKAISIDGKTEGIKINNDRCISCGNCFTACKNGAIKYELDIDIAQDLLDSEQKTAALVAPSIAAEFPDVTDYRNFVGMIRSLGFDYVHEVSFGVDLVAKKYNDLLRQSKGKYYISSFCHPIVDYIRKYQANLIDSLTPLVSPMIASAKVVRELHGKDIKIIYIGPCMGQKAEVKEFTDDGKIDAVLGFYELREMFESQNMTENSVEFSEFDPPHGYKGSLYPICNGILQAGGINEDLSTGKIFSVEGKQYFQQTVENFEKIASIKHHLNQFFCDGCAMGPLTTQTKTNKLQRHSLVINYANKRIQLLDRTKWEKEMKKYEHLDLSRTYKVNNQRLPDPPKEKIEEVLQLLGKDKPLNIDCGLCGYASCYDFAIDMAKDLTRPEMCVNFTMRNRQEYILKLQSSNRQLYKAQEALKKSEQKTKEEHEGVKEAMQILTSVMQKLPSGVVIVDKDYRIIQSNNRFVNILGDEARAINDVIPGLETADINSLLPYQIVNLFKYVLEHNRPIQNKDISLEDNLLNISIFPIKRKEVIGAIIRDLFEPAVRKEETIERVKDVIDKNLAMVQKIGFLLGEGASETEQMLNTIVKSFEKERKNKN